MLSLANRILPNLAAAAGISAFAMPLVTPWYLSAVLAATLSATFLATGRQRIFIGSAAFLGLILVFRGELSAPLAAACFSALALAIVNRVALAIGVLILGLSVAASAQELLGDLFHRFSLEAAAPGILCALVLLLASTSRARAFLVIGAGVLTIGVVWTATRVASSPEVVMAIGAIPVTLLAASYGGAKPVSRLTAIPMGIVLVGAMAIWAWTPPKGSEETWVLLPEAPESYEARFFENYLEALHFAGVNAKQATTEEEIPLGAAVLIPWVTEPFKDDRRIGELARERRWTVVIGGEHTNMGDVATRVDEMSGRALLRQDLTTPRGNTDTSGPMRSSEIEAWPHASIFNRGASVAISSLTDKVLLTGDGWWAEPDIGEWLWVGDYFWRHGDRAGRLAMIAASDINGARWIVLGDNSPLLNSQIIADPRAIIRILKAATLWPSFFNDLLLAVLAFVIAIGIAPSVVALLSVVVPITVTLSDRPSEAWKDFFVGESGFNERNFNNALADNPSIIVGRRMIRLKTPVSGHLALTEEPAILFLQIDDEVEIGGTRFDRCRRLGSLPTSEGPYLMDAQACRVTGPGEVLIGTREAAAAIAIEGTLVILDIAFLGQMAPLANTEWLLKESHQ